MPCSVRLACIDPRSVRVAWPLARELIRSAIERVDMCDFENVERDVLEGKQFLWLAWSDSTESCDKGPTVEAATVTRLCGPDENKVCELVACGGADRNRWLPLIAEIEQFARNEGCAKMRIIGRKGWERVLDGYGVRHVVLEKGLA